jgi:hypothetical protein
LEAAGKTGNEFGRKSRSKIIAGLEERATLTAAQDDYIRPGHPARNLLSQTTKSLAREN